MNRNDQGMDRMHTMNGKRGPPSQRPRDLPRELPRDIPRDMSRDIQREVPHSQHDAIINYILDSWNTVYSEVQQGTQGNGNVGYYHEPNFKLKDFQPFDLDAWWGRRVHQNITAQPS